MTSSLHLLTIDDIWPLFSLYITETHYLQQLWAKLDRQLTCYMYNEHCFSWRATMKLYNCKLFVTLILWMALSSFPSTNGQRLSQGASDWYMRFHSNFKFIKRNVDRPVTKSFIVDSRIKYRYAITQVMTQSAKKRWVCSHRNFFVKIAYWVI